VVHGPMEVALMPSQVERFPAISQEAKGPQHLDGITRR
jgi:hypothetical protein